MAWRSGTIGSARVLVASLIGLALIGCDSVKDGSVAAPRDSGPRNSGPMKTGDSTAADENSVDATRSLSMQQEIDQIRAALTAGRTEQAELSVRRLLVSHRDDRQVQSLVGEVLRQRKKFDEAASWAFEMSDAETTAAVSLGSGTTRCSS